MLAKKEIIATSLFVSIIFIPLRCREQEKTEINEYYFAVLIDGIFTFLFSHNLRFCMQIVCYEICKQFCNAIVTI